MKMLMNRVDKIRDEALDGFALAHAETVVLGAEREYVRRRQVKPGKVALISGGGAGHEPLHIGFVGHGMLDAACPGQIFTSPNPNQMLNAAKAVDGGAGILFIVKNYPGDMMKFEMAAEMLELDNAMVIVNDDVALEDSPHTNGRRGVAGTLIVEKILGAAAERGYTLEQLKELGDSVNKNTASMGVALTSCTVPAAGKPTFHISESDMEIGVGIHGEPGRRRVPLATPDAIANELAGAVIKDLSLTTGQEVILLVNGFGGTPLQELYLMVNATRKVLEKAGHPGRALPHRLLRHLARDGRLLDHLHARQPGNPPALGRPRPYPGPPLGDVVPPSFRRNHLFAASTSLD
jgi:dihydroxyacetone kinase-like protein